MKIVRKNGDKDFRNVTLRIDEKLMERIDRIATDNDLSRQALITAILKKATEDKSFTLEIEN